MLGKLMSTNFGLIKGAKSASHSFRSRVVVVVVIIDDDLSVRGKSAVTVVVDRCNRRIAALVLRWSGRAYISVVGM